MIQFFKMYFWDVVSNHYADFKGRTSRKQYWYFVLVSFVLNFIVGFIIGFIIGFSRSAFNVSMTVANAVLPWDILWICAMTIPIIAIDARRLHDINRSGWFQLLWMPALLVSDVMWIFLKNHTPILVVILILSSVTEIIFACLPSVEPNKFDGKQTNIAGNIDDSNT